MPVQPTPPPSIDSLSETPNRGTDTPTEFSDKTDTFLNELDPFGTQQNTLAGWSEDTAQEVYENALETADSAQSASDSATIATGSASYKGQWADLTGALNQPASVAHNGGFWLLDTNLADVTASEPSLSNADWQFYDGTRWINIAATAPVYPRSQIMVDATGADVGLTLPTLPTLPTMAENDFLVVSNFAGSDSLVRLINSTYTIYGNAGTISAGDDLTLAPGDTVHLVCKATNILGVV